MSAAQFPQKLAFLFEPYRYKVAYGGRGGAKSWGFARALLLIGAQRPIRVLCAREMQNSIQDSVHKLLSDQIADLGLSHLYAVEKAVIRGANGTEFRFEGIRHNVTQIKSYEGVDICWVEEAQGVSKTSWDVLIPTIRKEGSEIWLTFNPDLESDETYQRFVKHPPPSSHVAKLTWRDNPWFPEVLRAEMEDLKAKNYDSYLHVWEGECRQMLEGAVFAEELRAAKAEGRICRVPYDSTKPVSTFWDLGWSDLTSIWFGQMVGFELRIIDFYQNRQQTLDHYLRTLQQRGYVYDTLWLPHDAKAKQLGTGRSIEEMARAKGFRVLITPKASVADGINAARMVFPNCYFDADRCADGLQALTHYRYEVVEGQNGMLSRLPVHDQHCFVAETEVLTRNGRRQIKDLDDKVDEVLTPCGYKPFHQLGVTRTAAQLVEVAFTDGLTVKCTPEHLFLTENGWKSAEFLTPGTTIQSCWTPEQLTTVDDFTGIGPHRRISRALEESSIVLSGLMPLAQYLRAAISITRTEIQGIIALIISNAFPPLNILATLGPRLALERMNISALGRASPQRHGIGVKLGGFGIANMHSMGGIGKNGPENLEFAPSVGENFSGWFVKAPDLSGSAAQAVRPLRIGSVKWMKERSDVTCIEVPDTHCFALANGAVVHNSHAADAFRYLAMALRAPKARGLQALADASKKKLLDLGALAGESVGLGWMS